MQALALKNRKLADSKTLQEAAKILNAWGIPKNSAIRKLVGLAYKMTDDDDKKHTLQEADESAIGKDEKPYSERGGQKNADEQTEEDKTHGNTEARPPPEGEGELHGQPTHGTDSDVPTPEAPAGDGDAEKTADEQKGGSQLGGSGNKENMPYYQMMDQQQPSPDMLNNSVIGMMDNQNGPGMSKVAAEQAAGGQARDQMGFLQEAIRPILTRMWKDHITEKTRNDNLQEAVKILNSSGVKGKISLQKSSGPGGNKNQEALVSGVDPSVEETVSNLETIANDPMAIDSLQRGIMNDYVN